VSKAEAFKFCTECNIKFFHRPDDSHWLTRKFCSPECSRRYQKKNFKLGKGRRYGSQ